jgi:endoglucanase
VFPEHQFALRFAAALRTTNYYFPKVYLDLFDKESVYRGLCFLLGTHPAANSSFVATVGTGSKHLAYGINRADFTFQLLEE